MILVPVPIHNFIHKPAFTTQDAEDYSKDRHKFPYSSNSGQSILGKYNWSWACRMIQNLKTKKAKEIAYVKALGRKVWLIEHSWSVRVTGKS